MHPSFNYREVFEVLCGSNTFSGECERHERVLQTIERERLALQCRITKANRQHQICSRIIKDNQRVKTNLVRLRYILRYCSITYYILQESVDLLYLYNLHNHFENVLGAELVKVDQKKNHINYLKYFDSVSISLFVILSYFKHLVVYCLKTKCCLVTGFQVIC